MMAKRFFAKKQRGFFNMSRNKESEGVVTGEVIVDWGGGGGV